MENNILNHRKQVAGRISKSMEPSNVENYLEKGKKANLGEIREWSGKKYQKTTQGWALVKETRSGKFKDGKLILPRGSTLADVHTAYSELLAENLKDRLSPSELDDLAEWSIKGGYNPINAEGVEKIINELSSGKFKALIHRLRYNVKGISFSSKERGIRVMSSVNKLIEKLDSSQKLTEKDIQVHSNKGAQ